jgi:hypothetical protein
MPKVGIVTFHTNLFRDFKIVCKETDGQGRGGHATVRNSIQHTWHISFANSPKIITTFIQ